MKKSGRKKFLPNYHPLKIANEKSAPLKIISKRYSNITQNFILYQLGVTKF